MTSKVFIAIAFLALPSLALLSCIKNNQVQKSGTMKSTEQNSVFQNVTREGGVLAIIQVKVKNPEKFIAYVQGHLPSIEKYGGKILYEGLGQKNIQGEQDLKDLVVVQLWENEDIFHQWWNSPEYKPWKDMRHEGANVSLSISKQRPEKLKL